MLSAAEITGSVNPASLAGRIASARLTGSLTGARLSARLSTARIGAKLSTGALSGSVGLASSYPTYAGATEFTPSRDTQTVSVGGKLTMQDITINPIPSNYGLITWNGSTLTVS